MRRIDRSIVVLGWLCIHGSCTQQAPVIPSVVTAPDPTAESPGATSPPDPLALPAGPSLSGTVYEYGGDPVSGGTISYSVSSAIGHIGHLTGRVSLDTHGRYVIDGLSDGNWVRVSAAPRDRGALRLVQPCASNAVIKGKTALDVELVPLGINDGSRRSPIVSGVVTQTIGGTTYPVRTSVVYYSILRAPWDAFTETDENGAYTMCGVPLGAAIVAAGYACNEAMKHVDVDIRGDSRVDIDLTNFQCPGY